MTPQKKAQSMERHDVGWTGCPCCQSDVAIYAPLTGEELAEWKKQRILACRRELHAQKQWAAHRKGGKATVKTNGRYKNIDPTIKTKRGMILSVGGMMPKPSDVFEFQLSA